MKSSQINTKKTARVFDVLQ